MDIEELYKVKHCSKKDRRIWNKRLEKYNKAVEKFGYFPFINFEAVKLLGIKLEDNDMKIYGYWARSLVASDFNLNHPNFLEYKEAYLNGGVLWLKEGKTYVDMEKNRRVK